MKRIIATSIIAVLASPVLANGNDYQQTKPVNNVAAAAALAASKAAAKSASKSSSNSSASVVNSNNFKAAASSAYAPSGNVTAPCQKYASAGGQGINFGFSFGFSLDSKRCWTLEQAERYKKVYGVGVVRAYYEAHDPVLRKIVSIQPKAKPVKAKPRKARKAKCGCK